ncbi:nicotinamide riboside kinase 1 [Diabrotica virgifera virgifera]|uniref:Nicotinamide riboside kinase 1 n=1 Tax=Diabrotica virgifera virgifera TaxID=50390 RepID=A0A6P7F4W6_DIAVI|nr:nicotinamide riboside kinase 1 [Diabrotica virgifera virgifera]
MSKQKCTEFLLVVGISGVTCGGKTTTAKKLRAMLPKATIISQDDYFLSEDDPRHIWIPELNHANWDVITSLDMERMYRDISTLLKNDSSRRVTHKFQKIRKPVHDINYICDILKTAKLKVIIVEGFCIFNYKPLLQFFDLMYYFTLTKEECFERRELRTYDPPDCPGYFDLCAWPEHLSQLEEVRKTVDGIKFCSGKADVVEDILRDIFFLYSSI